MDPYGVVERNSSIVDRSCKIRFQKSLFSLFPSDSRPLSSFFDKKYLPAPFVCAEDDACVSHSARPPSSRISRVSLSPLAQCSDFHKLFLLCRPVHPSQVAADCENPDSCPSLKFACAMNCPRLQTVTFLLGRGVPDGDYPHSILRSSKREPVRIVLGCPPPPGRRLQISSPPSMERVGSSKANQCPKHVGNLPGS